MALRLIDLISKKTNCTCSTLFLLISKKTNLHVQHAFLSFPCRCFARLQRCFERLKRQTSQLHIIFMEELSYVLTQYFVSCVHVRFYFSLPLIFTLLASSISHFLTAALNYHVFLPTKLVSSDGQITTFPQLWGFAPRVELRYNAVFLALLNAGNCTVYTGFLYILILITLCTSFSLTF